MAKSVEFHKEQSRLTLKEAQANSGSIYLEKPMGKDYETRVDKLPISSKVKNKLKKLNGYGRDQLHLLRLLSPGRSKAERNFALDYIEHVDDVKTSLRMDPEREESIMGVIGSEGDDTCMWWTFAPYLHSALREQAVRAKDAIKQIVNWAKNGRSVATSERSGDWSRVHLKGLEDVYRIYALAKDPKSPSHQFTKERAKEIVEKGFLK